MDFFSGIFRRAFGINEEDHVGYRDNVDSITNRGYPPPHIRREFVENSKIKEVVYERNSVKQNQNPSPTTPVPEKQGDPKPSHSTFSHGRSTNPVPAPFSSKQPFPSSSSGPPPFSSKPSPSPSSSGPPPFFSKPSPSPSSSPSSSGPPPFFSKPSPSPSSSGPPSSTSKLLFPSPSSLDPPISPNKTEYLWVDKGTTPIYAIPEDIKDLVKNGIVPGVLKKPLSPSTYRDYFAALLYAEDYYIELEEAAIYEKPSKDKKLIKRDKGVEKLFVSFQIDSIPERRPFLLSRDFVLARPSGKNIEPFKGILYRVVKRTLVLVEFGDDFHSQHSPNREYDVSFSFNRVCLKRSHQAVAAAMDPSFRSFLFPNQMSRTSFLTPSSRISSHLHLNEKQASAISHITRLNGPPPYLVEGPLSVASNKGISSTGLVVQAAVVQICRNSPGCRILISAPTNNTCDVLMRGLKGEIPESDMFRANAAFRELDGVPYDILPSCLYKGECFTCPSLLELRNFKVILSTFVSSFRLHSEGISAGHFSHIFLVDASSATEPETTVVLANLADDNTAVVVTGASGNCSGWVRSDIARGNGLKISYFQRLFESEPYSSLNPMLVTCIE